MGNESSSGKRSKSATSTPSKKEAAAARLQKALPAALKGASGELSSTALQRHIERARKSRTLQLKGVALKSLPPVVVDEVAGGVGFKFERNFSFKLDISYKPINYLICWEQRTLFWMTKVPIFQLHDQLRNLDLSDNKIRELPLSIGTFCMLRHLHINNNRLTSLPDEIGCLKTLEVLNASGSFIIKYLYVQNFQEISWVHCPTRWRRATHCFSSIWATTNSPNFRWFLPSFCGWKFWMCLKMWSLHCQMRLYYYVVYYMDWFVANTQTKFKPYFCKAPSI